MQLNLVFVFPVLASLFSRMVHGTILCSSCRSDTEPSCETRPPTPKPCAKSSSGIVESCSTVKIYEKNSEAIHMFIRSCASSDRNGCFDSLPGYHTCAEICYTDGCNTASSPHTNFVLTLVCAVCLSFINVLAHFSIM
ncbi:uncharacterized protein LOC101861616 [Aplysia californica]|uniref:Uncharacterized protein LOC101861616 n=1 Tax=Aplysia californica TaxID=6500 RepID=A0ABM0K4X9_APLCA|nr:uncharacterized protein LOC101861616 [Aplysia californica]